MSRSPYRRARVIDEGGVRTLKFERNQQSSMHLDDPCATDIQYVAYLHAAVAVKPDPTRALVIGLGGGSIVKQLWRDHPLLQIDAVEIDPEVAAIACELFAVPTERVEIYQGDGREALGLLPGPYDIVVVDAFDDDRVPPHLTTEEFMRELRAVMSPDGAVAWNVFGAVYGPRSKWFRSLHRTMANVWQHVWVFPVRISIDPVDDTRNVVVIASDAPMSTDELLERIASRVDGRVGTPGFETLREDLYTGPVRTGDVPLLLDPGTRRR